ncbi:MAG: hypothetical protein AAB897_01310 [Patescibacteria group bacterium]
MHESERQLEPEPQLTNIDEAVVGASAEKPLRDLARKTGRTSEEKTILDSAAGIAGEEAVREFKLEKEQSPETQLRNRLAKIATAMKEKGLHEDAVLVEATLKRFEQYPEFLRGIKKALAEEELDFSLQALVARGLKNERGLIVAGQYSKDGGYNVYNPTYIAPNTREGYEGWNKLHGHKYPHEFISRFFSPEGEVEFLRGLGVIGSQQDSGVEELRVAFGRVDEKLREDGVARYLYESRPDGSKKLDVALPTSAKGLSVHIRKDTDTKLPTKRIDLFFSNDYLEGLLRK